MTFDFTPPGKNNPQDLRNMIIFVVAAILVWFVFDHFIMKPRAAAMKEAATIEAQLTPEQKAALEKEETPLAKPEALAALPRVSFESSELKGSIPTVGGRIDDITLKNFVTELHGTTPVTLFSPTGVLHAHYAEIGWLADDPEIKVPGKKTVWTVQQRGDLSKAHPLVLVWENGQGLKFERKITVDRHYLFTVAQRVTNAGQATVALYPYSSIARSGFPTHEKGPGYEGPLGYLDDNLEEPGYADTAEEKEAVKVSAGGWIGFGEKYWLSALIPDQGGRQTYRFSAQVNPGKPDLQKTLYQVDVRNEPLSLIPGASVENVTRLFVGAKRVDLLEKYESQLKIPHFDLAVDFGVLYFLTRPLYFLLTLFNSWVGNFGVAILMLTLTVRAAVFPLASASYRSFAKLRKVSPKMAELKIKYGADKPKLQQELVKLYETEKVNPMAGCFPLLLQIPIFFAVYKVISISIEMRHAPFIGWIHDLSGPDPYSVFNLFGLIDFTPPRMLMIGPWSLAMLSLMLIQKHLNPPPQDQIQKDIANFMPWVVTITLANFPSGLIIYWTFSNLISVIQQWFIMHSMGVPVYLFSPDRAREYADSHNQEIEKAAERARQEREAEKKAQEEPVKESLFDENKEKP